MKGVNLKEFRGEGGAEARARHGMLAGSGEPTSHPTLVGEEPPRLAGTPAVAGGGRMGGRHPAVGGNDGREESASAGKQKVIIMNHHAIIN